MNPRWGDCHWCGRGPMTLTRDHIIPRKLGGSGYASNTAWACFDCNQVKGDMTPHEWAVVMRDVPEWWRLNAMRGPRGAQLAKAMSECGFDFNLASPAQARETWWAA